MNAALEDVTKRKRPEPPAGEIAAQELARRSREQGLSLTRPDELLKQLAETVLETALNHELTGRLGHGEHADRRERAGRDPGQDGPRRRRSPGSPAR
jgi:transposase-like protein